MTKDERQKIYAALAAPFPEDAIERTDGRVTGRGYSTTGIKYQYVVNRLNDVLGVGGFRVERTVSVKEAQTTKGRAAFEATCEVKLQLGEWTDGTFVTFGEAVGDGGHTAMTEVDARKGSYTNSFKKAAAFFGVGRQAYEGSLDDDNVSMSEHAAPAASPPVQVAARPSANPALPERTRLTAKQHTAIRGLAREHGYEDNELREQSRRRFGVEIDFLTRAQASELITSLSSNGQDRQASRGA